MQIINKFEQPISTASESNNYLIDIKDTYLFNGWMTNSISVVSIGYVMSICVTIGSTICSSVGIIVISIGLTEKIVVCITMFIIKSVTDPILESLVIVLLCFLVIEIR